MNCLSVRLFCDIRQDQIEEALQSVGVDPSTCIVHFRTLPFANEWYLSVRTPTEDVSEIEFAAILAKILQMKTVTQLPEAEDAEGYWLLIEPDSTTYVVPDDHETGAINWDRSAWRAR